MSSAENESIKDFLASKQKEIEKRQNKKSKAEEFGNFVANLNIKNKNNKSSEDYRNLAYKTIFVTGGLFILDQASGYNLFGSTVSKIIPNMDNIDNTLSPLKSLLEEDRLNQGANKAMANVADFVYNSGQSLKSEQMSEFDITLIKLSISFNQYFDTNVVDFHKVLEYSKIFGSLSIAAASSHMLKNSKLAEDIAAYSEEGTDLAMNERLKYAKNQNADVQTESFIRGTLSKTFKEFKIEQWMSSVVGDMIKHITSPKKSAQKTWLTLNIGKNNLKSMFTFDIDKKSELEEKNLRIKKEIKSLKINDYQESLDVLKEDAYFNQRPDSFSPHKEIAKASKNAYESVLKSNIKNSLSKSLFVLGDKDKTKEEKEKALNILNKISILNEKTKKNNFNDFEILSKIAKTELEKIKYNANQSQNQLCKNFRNFGVARNYVNNRQEEWLNSLTFKLSDGNIDHKKDIPDKVSFDKVFLEVNIPNAMKEVKSKEEYSEKLSQKYAEEENKKSRQRRRMI